MATKEFRPVTSPSKSKHGDGGDVFTFFVKDAFPLQTFLLGGALLQLALLATLPYRLAVAPVALLGGYTLFTTVNEAIKGPYSGYMKNVILGRTSAQLPTSDTGSFGYQPAAQSIVVFHFGVRFNHPLGVLSPGAKATIDHFTACNNLVMAKSDEYGMLGLSAWRAAERASDNTLMMVYYFKDIEGLNKFAHGEIHRKAWDWIVKAGHKHIGFFHEAFAVPPKAYETIYVNFQPLLMGATDVKVADHNGEEVWMQPLVDADAGPLKSQLGRMGRGFKELLEKQED